MKNTKTKIVAILSLCMFVAQAAHADCTTRMLERAKIVDKNDRVARKVNNASRPMLIVGLLAGMVVPPVGLGLMAGALATSGGLAIRDGVNNNRDNKMADLNAILGYVKGSNAQGQAAYDVLRDRVQEMDSSITDDQIRNAIVIADRDETLCPHAHAMNTRKTAKAIVSVIRDLAPAPEAAAQ